MTNPNTLVILGCGYVGSALAHEALAAGWDVTAVVRSAESVARLAAQGIRALAVDLSAADLAVALPSARHVVYAASAGGGGLAGYQRTYVDGVRAAVAWAERMGAASFAFTSSTGVYRQNGDTDEDSPVGGSATADILVTGEGLVLASQIPSRTVLRLGGLYGPGRQYLAAQVRSGNYTFAGPCAHRINYLHRDDAAHAIWLALTLPTGARVLNVTDGAPVVKADLAKWLCARAGVEAVFDPHAPGPMRQGPEPPPDRAILSRRAREVLGWQPRYANIHAALTAEGEA